jgi:hypothetical protein
VCVCRSVSGFLFADFLCRALWLVIESDRTHTHTGTRSAKPNGMDAEEEEEEETREAPAFWLKATKKTQSIHFDNGTIRLIGHGDDIEKYFISIYSWYGKTTTTTTTYA